MGLALLLVIGVLAFAGVGDDGLRLHAPGSLADSSSRSAKDAVASFDIGVGEIVASTAARASDEARSPAGRMFSVTLASGIALAACVAWRRMRTSPLASHATRAIALARLRAPPALRTA
jgi:hypothetical protein